MQAKVNETAPEIVQHYRRFVSRTFSEENPYTQYLATIMMTTNDIFESEIIQDKNG